MNITIVTRTAKGKAYSSYCVWYESRRHLFKTKAEAQAFIDNVNKVKEESGRKAASLFSEYGVDVLSAINILKEAGLTPKHLKRAAHEYVSRMSKKHSDATLQQIADAYAEYLKKNRAVSTETVARQAVKLFVEQIGGNRHPAEISNGEILDAMEAIAEGRMNATYNSILRRLKAFVSWAFRRDYPVSSGMFDHVERRYVAAKEPRFIKLDEIARLFAEAKKLPDARNVLAYFTLQYFAGLRTCEILALEPENYRFHEEAPCIRVSRTKGVSRGCRGRNVDLEPNCANILRKLFPKGYTPTITHETARIANKCYKMADITDHHNIGRHSFITYHVAKYCDEQRTVTLCGTSKDMAAFHYKGLATKSDADRYFSIG